MKQAVLLLSICILSFLYSPAQNKKITYGFLGGINFNSAHGSGIDKDRCSILRGINAGSFVKLTTSKNFALRAGVEYDELGYSYRDLSFETSAGNGLVRGDLFVERNYLNFPVSGEYSFGNKTRFYTNAGVFFGVLLNNKTTFKPSYDSENSLSFRSNAALLSNINYGLVVGTGVEVPIGKCLKAGFSLQNKLGLKNINKSGSSAAETTIKTNAVSIGCSIGFAL
ncbi:MAG: PorT family protein [Gloeobacteraceae cyanobacterium ES-bin-316]|nr:PorT family protein [Ferruginibacter sp.]